MNKWGVCSVICGAICLAFGIMFFSGAISDQRGDMFTVELIFGLPGIAGGACGIAGGLSVKSNRAAARKLLLAAAIILLPYAFVFFWLFMVARNKATGTEDVWGEGEEKL